MVIIFILWAASVAAGLAVGYFGTRALLARIDHPDYRERRRAEGLARIIAVPPTQGR